MKTPICTFCRELIPEYHLWVYYDDVIIMTSLALWIRTLSRLWANFFHQACIASPIKQLSSYTKSCFHEFTSKDVIVTGLYQDVSHVCSFAGRDALLLGNKEFNNICSLFVGQASDLGCFKCPSCAKPYISATWFQKHLSKCRQPTGAITGLIWTLYTGIIFGIVAKTFRSENERQNAVTCGMLSTATSSYLMFIIDVTVTSPQWNSQRVLSNKFPAKSTSQIFHFKN